MQDDIDIEMDDDTEQAAQRRRPGGGRGSGQWAMWGPEDAAYWGGQGRRRFARGGRGPGHGRGGPPRGGFGGGFGPRGGRMRRGDIRTAVLVVLSEQDGHGYQLIQALEAKTDGAWRPSPGSVYPTLQLLEDTGLATSELRDGKRVYSITDEGRAEADRRVDEAGRLPWEQGPQDGGLRGAMMQLHLAARQINAEGDPEHVEAAIAVVNDARKQLYRLLAD